MIYGQAIEVLHDGCLHSSCKWEWPENSQPQMNAYEEVEMGSWY